MPSRAQAHAAFAWEERPGASEDASGSPKRGAPGNWNRFGEKEIHGGGTEAFEMWNAERTLKHSLGMGKTRSDERRRWMGRNQRLQNRG